jgi:hypothetical protein
MGIPPTLRSTQRMRWSRRPWAYPNAHEERQTTNAGRFSPSPPPLGMHTLPTEEPKNRGCRDSSSKAGGTFTPWLRVVRLGGGVACQLPPSAPRVRG